MLLIIATLILALYPQYAWGVICFIVLGELTSKTSTIPSKKKVRFDVEVAFVLFCTYVFRILGNDIISLALLLATFGLTLSHSLVHKYNLYHWSVLYRIHREHHISSQDPERSLRLLPWYSYIVRKLKLYVTSKWTALDYILIVMLCIYGLKALVAAVLALAMIELIGFCQHTIDNRVVNCHNHFMNTISDNAGFHSIHHGEVDCAHTWKYGAMTGLLASSSWVLICALLRILLLLPWPKANIPGAYLFGFTQNVSNYIATNGRDVRNLLYRVPSIFEQPTLLLEYLLIMVKKVRMKNYRVLPFLAKDKLLKLSHGVCQNRNIYMFGYKPSDGDIIVFRDTIIEGHHRYTAGYRDSMKEIIEVGE